MRNPQLQRANCATLVCRRDRAGPPAHSAVPRSSAAHAIWGEGQAFPFFLTRDNGAALLSTTRTQPPPHTLSQRRARPPDWGTFCSMKRGLSRALERRGKAQLPLLSVSVLILSQSSTKQTPLEKHCSRAWILASKHGFESYLYCVAWNISLTWRGAADSC